MFPVLALIVTACSNPVKERKEYWEHIVAAQIPVGSDKAAIETWATQKSLHIHFDPTTRHLGGPLEYVTTNDLVCMGWAIGLDISLDNEGKAISEHVYTLGNCS